MELSLWTLFKKLMLNLHLPVSKRMKSTHGLNGSLKFSWDTIVKAFGIFEFLFKKGLCRKGEIFTPIAHQRMD